MSGRIKPPAAIARQRVAHLVTGNKRLIDMLAYAYEIGVADAAGVMSARVGSPKRDGETRDDYRGWQIEYSPPPIPVRDFDWNATHPDYDGAAGADDNRRVFGKSWDAVRSEIDEYFEEGGL